MARYVSIGGKLMEVGEKVVYLGSGCPGLTFNRIYTINGIGTDPNDAPASISLAEAPGWFYLAEYFKPATGPGALSVERTLEPWEDKAHHLIGQMARAAFEKANRLPGGSLRKKHVPYSLPEDAVKLVEALGAHDEAGAKAIFQALAFRKPE